MRIEFRIIKKSIKLYSMLQQVTLKGLRISHSGFRIPDSGFLTFHKANKNMADKVQITFHRLLPLLRWVKIIATWKTVIESYRTHLIPNDNLIVYHLLHFKSVTNRHFTFDKFPSVAMWIHHHIISLNGDCKQSTN